MTHQTIKEILAGRVDVGTPVLIEGWLRTRRDSKAGLSFLQVHDGSSPWASAVGRHYAPARAC